MNTTYIAPAVPGAAVYSAGQLANGRWAVLMKTTDGYVDEIQVCATERAAINAAARWQRKENAAVLKATA